MKNIKKFLIVIVLFGIALLVNVVNVKAANKENNVIEQTTDNGEINIENIKLQGENVECYNVEETSGKLILANSTASDVQKNYAFGSAVNASEIGENDFVEVTFDVFELGATTWFWYNGFTVDKFGFTDDNGNSFKAALISSGMAYLNGGNNAKFYATADGKEKTASGAWISHGLTEGYLSNHIAAYGNLSMKFEFYQNGTIRIYYGFLDRSNGEVSKTVWKESMWVENAYEFKKTEEKYYFSFGIGNAVATEKIVVDNYRLQVVTPAVYDETTSLKFENPQGLDTQKFAAFGNEIEKAKLADADFVEVTFDVLELGDNTWFWYNGFTTDSLGFTDDNQGVFKAWLKANGQAGISSGANAKLFDGVGTEKAAAGAWITHGLTTGYVNDHVAAYGHLSMKFEFYTNGDILIYYGAINRDNGSMAKDWKLSQKVTGAYSYSGTADKYYFSFGIGNATNTEKIVVDNYESRIHNAGIVTDTKVTLSNENAGAAQKYESFGKAVTKLELTGAEYVEAIFDVYELDSATWFWYNGFTVDENGTTDDAQGVFKAWLKANGQAGISSGANAKLFDGAGTEKAAAAAWVAHGLTNGYVNDHVTAYGHLSMKFEFYTNGDILIYYGAINRDDGSMAKDWTLSQKVTGAYSYSGTADKYYFSFGIGNNGATEKIVIDNFDVNVVKASDDSITLVNADNGSAQKYAAFQKTVLKSELTDVQMVTATFDVTELDATTWFWYNGFTTDSFGFTDDAQGAFKAWLKANGQAGISSGANAKLFDGAGTEKAAAAAWVAHGLTNGYVNDHVTAHGHLSMKFEFYTNGDILIYYGAINRDNGSMAKDWTLSQKVTGAYSYSGTNDKYYFSFGIGNAGKDEKIKVSNFELNVVTQTATNLVNSTIDTRSTAPAKKEAVVVTTDTIYKNATLPQATGSGYVDVEVKLATANATSKLVSDEVSKVVTFVDFEDYAKFVEEPAQSDEIATKNFYKVTYLKATNPAQDNRVESLAKLKYDENATVAFELNTSLAIMEIAAGKKFAIAFGLEARTTELDDASYIYFENVENVTYLGTVVKGVESDNKISFGKNLADGNFFDVSLSCNNALVLTGTIAGVEINTTIGGVAGYIAFTQVGEGNLTFAINEVCSLVNYTYRAGTGVDIEHPFNTDYLDSDLFTIQSNQSSYIVDPSLSEGLTIEDGKLNFKCTGLHTHFATKETYADFILEFDYTTDPISERPEVGDVGGNFGYSGLGIAFGKPEALGAWSSGKLIMIRDTYTKNENFGGSYVQFYRSNGAKDSITKAIANRVEAEVGTEGAITSYETNFTYTLEPVEGMPKVYDATTRLRLVVLNNEVTLYGANIVDGVCQEFVEIISGEVKDSYGYISLSTDTNGCFSIDNFRLYNLDALTLEGKTKDEILSTYDDNKVLADVEEPKKIATPVLTLNDNVVTWDTVENASAYIVTVNGVAKEAQTETSYTITETKVGEYVVTVQAISDGEKTHLDSSVSKSVTYKVETQGGDEDPTVDPVNPKDDDDDVKKKGCKNSLVLSLVFAPAASIVVLSLKKRREE